MFSLSFFTFLTFLGLQDFGRPWAGHLLSPGHLLVWSWTMTHTSSLGSQNPLKTLAKLKKMHQYSQKAYVFIDFFDFFDSESPKAYVFIDFFDFFDFFRPPRLWQALGWPLAQPEPLKVPRTLESQKSQKSQ